MYSCMYNMSTRCITRSILLWLHLLFQPIPQILVYTVRTLHGYTYRFLQPTYSRVFSPPFFVHLTRILQDFNYNIQYTLPNKKECNVLRSAQGIGGDRRAQNTLAYSASDEYFEWLSQSCSKVKQTLAGE